MGERFRALRRRWQDVAHPAVHLSEFVNSLGLCAPVFGVRLPEITVQKGDRAGLTRLNI